MLDGPASPLGSHRSVMARPGDRMFNGDRAQLVFRHLDYLDVGS